jgi:cardiolipin synthase
MNTTGASLLGLAVLAAAVIASGHAVLYKRDSRGAMLWVVVIWFVPILGPALYGGFGINRIKRRATMLRRRRERPALAAPAPGELAVVAPAFATLADVAGRLTQRPLVPGNCIEPLANNEQAFPAMLAAIREARESISLSTYIFDRDEVGQAFAAELGAAVRRGVAVRVLIDATGTFFSWPSILPLLRREGVRFARFLPAISLGHPVSLNLRNHRKILVVDGRTGFTGGMNICRGHRVGRLPGRPMLDTHYRVTGPVVGQLQETFADDWYFSTDEVLRGPGWFPRLEAAGPMAARGITDGPDEDLERTRWIFLAAISQARRSVRILTPYFLPDNALISALNVAALRGVQVHILLPASSDVPFVQWASAAHWWQLLEHGCRIWVADRPFDHSKLFIVDGAWTLLGSSNWDPRSLRLNFEFNLECHDASLAAERADDFDQRLARATEVTLAIANARSLPVRFRDGVARLATPFL